MNCCVRVTAFGHNFEFEAESGERVLLAALRAGVMLPHECATGCCGTCRATVINGNCVSLWPDAPGARKLREANEVLTCQVAAIGDLELVIRGTVGCTDRMPSYVHGQITEWRRHNPEIAEFSVELEKSMHFIAGQFVLVEFPGIAGPRAYSMTSRPASEAKSLHFLIRNAGTGLVTGRLFETATVVGRVRFFGPLGRATYDPAERRPFVAVAGGTGIAGILSILDHATEAEHFAHFPSHLVFGLRTPGTAYLLDELAAVAQRSTEGLTITIAFSDAPADAALTAAYPGLRFFHGFAHEAARNILVAPDAKPLYYVAGPPAMVDATLRLLVTEQKISPINIRYDKFG